MFRNVVVGYDGSLQAHDAIALGVALTARGGRVTACCVHHVETIAGRIDLTEPHMSREQAQRCAAEAPRLVKGDVAVDSVAIEAADAAGALQAAVRSRGADLLAVGSSHRGPVGRVLLGSVTLQALHDPPCPVAIATVGQRDLSAGMRIRSIAVGCDVLEEPAEELSVALALADHLGAAVHIVAVADTAVALVAQTGGASAYPALLRARRVAAEEGLSKLMARMPPSISVTGEVREGKPAEKLAEVTHGVDLLVLGSHHYGAVSRLMRRSVASSLQRAADCPLLVVPRKD